ncbi:DedA family protein [Alicyclobacillus fodiniaquatilis]|uniref:DedA family protein n=1 Tax=Alicyclobacillus fodiniaquatilis TaxID=1661150 RepID=A0ABW4JS25_9BACL
MDIHHIVMTYGYIGFFLLLALEYLILVVPGETLLTTLGVLLHTQGVHFNLVLLIVATSLGTFTGSMLTYWIGRLLGRPMIIRYGKYVFLTEKRLNQAEQIFEQRALLSILVAKYIAVIRDIIPYVAGINQVRLRLYIPAQLVASFMWTTTFLLAGSLIERCGISIYHHWRTELLPGIFLLFLLIIGYRMIHKRIHRVFAPKNEHFGVLDPGEHFGEDGGQHEPERISKNSGC